MKQLLAFFIVFFSLTTSFAQLDFDHELHRIRLSNNTDCEYYVTFVGDNTNDSQTFVIKPAQTFDIIFSSDFSKCGTFLMILDARGCTPTCVERYAFPAFVVPRLTGKLGDSYQELEIGFGIDFMIEAKTCLRV